MAVTVKSGKDWALPVDVDAKVDAGVSVGIIVEVPAGLEVSVGAAEFSAKGCFASIEGVEVGAWIAGGVGLAIIGKTLGTTAIAVTTIAAIAPIMIKLS